MSTQAAVRLRGRVIIEDGRMLGLPAPAKLNLFLHVVGRRADGYHLLQTVFRFIDLADSVDIALRPDGAIVREQGLADVAADEDLAVRAARVLQQATGCALGASIRVRKRIPVGGGLGGGSSDAATVLLALNRLWKLDLPRSRMQEIGLQLGADVPVFVFGRSAFAEGIGDRLAAVELPAARYLVVYPGVGVPTAAVFADAGLTRNTPPVTLISFSEAMRARGIGSAIKASGWAPEAFGRNDLEPVARRRFREVQEALAWLDDAERSAAGPVGGARFGPPRMSGSGSCCFRTVDAQFRAPSPPAGMTAWLTEGLDEHPLLALLAC